MKKQSKQPRGCGLTMKIVDLNYKTYFGISLRTVQTLLSNTNYDLEKTIGKT